MGLRGGVTTEDGVLVFGGDAAFDVTQIRERRLAGIVEVPTDAKSEGSPTTLALTRARQPPCAR